MAFYQNNQHEARHINDRVTSHTPLTRFALTNLRCTFNANRREQRVLTFMKRELLAEKESMASVTPATERSKQIDVEIAGIDLDIAQLRRDNSALAADLLLAYKASWVEMLTGAFLAAHGSVTFHPHFSSTHDTYVDCSLLVAENVAARTGSPSRKDAAVKKLDDLIRADAGKERNAEDRFSPLPDDQGFAAAIPRIVQAAWDATQPKTEG